MLLSNTVQHISMLIYIIYMNTMLWNRSGRINITLRIDYNINIINSKYN